MRRDYRQAPLTEIELSVVLRMEKLGGTATVDELLPASVRTHTSFKRFHMLAVDPLEYRELVTVSADRSVLSLTHQGRAIAVANRVVPLSKPRDLDLAKLKRGAPFRPGADDYKKHPSRMGDELVPYKGNGGDKQQ